MIKGFVQLCPIQRGEYEQLISLAMQDNHGVYVPTHTVKRDGELHGYFSVGSPGVPVVYAWLDTKNIHARESIGLINMVENHVQLNGALSVSFPVPKNSPFHELMVPMGYKNCGNYDFFVKQLVKP